MDYLNNKTICCENKTEFWGIALVGLQWRTRLVILYLLASTGSVFINSVVIIAVFTGSALRENPCRILWALAISDLVTGLAGYLNMAEMVHQNSVDHQLLRNITYSIMSITLFSSTNITALISYDRYLRITRLQNSGTSKKCIDIVVTISWLVPVLCAILIRIIKNQYIMLLPFIEFTVPFFILLVCYVLILKALRGFTVRQENDQLDEAFVNNERHATHTIVIIATCFMLMNIPIMIGLAIRAKIGLTFHVARMNTIGTFLSFSNSLVNPLIYCYRSKKIRKDVLKFFSRFKIEDMV